jgi:multidrug efflux pump subunit AcrA (membrane-fusion protein)
MVDSAPIYSLNEGALRAESAAWARFSAAKDSAEFWTSWLAILCIQIERVGGALLLLGPDEKGAFVPAAVWPHAGRDLQYLSGTAQRALTERRGVVVAADGTSPPARDQRAFLGYPLELAGTMHGAVVLDLAPGPEDALQRALRLLHWASAWVLDRLRKRALEQREAQLSRMDLAMDVVATALQEEHFDASAIAVANELAKRMECDRVSVGLESRGSVEVRAISHTASFDPKTNLARMIGEAMDEVLDLDVTLVHPPRDEGDLVGIAHAELAREFRSEAICSVPLLKDGHATGVLTLERATPFDSETVDLTKTVGALLGPILDLKQRNDQGLLRHAGLVAHDALIAVVGPRHPGVKLVALLVAGIVAFFSVVDATYRVAAKTVVEGLSQRVAAAPFEGYITQSFVRAGDVVQEGQVLCQLDDRELKLEQSRLDAERAQLKRKYRQSLATQDRPAMAVLSAQLNQVEAALALVADKLARTALKAPFDGVVISGDLNPLLGTPVEQGKVLFQIAPLDKYRVILQVDERDIAHVKKGQPGQLTLSGMLSDRLGFAVDQITPISTAQEGRNFFRVEARLENSSERVRPGMEGVGKIVVGERKLIWIWTHSLVDWLRLSIWKWMP